MKSICSGGIYYQENNRKKTLCAFLFSDFPRTFSIQSLTLTVIALVTASRSAAILQFWIRWKGFQFSEKILMNNVWIFKGLSSKLTARPPRESPPSRHTFFLEALISDKIVSHLFCARKDCVCVCACECVWVRVCVGVCVRVRGHCLVTRPRGPAGTDNELCTCTQDDKAPATDVHPLCLLHLSIFN